ncbi:MAG: hypothetical protein IJB10_04870, partial [Clostridia bacterium]|nr:hypothetical protein [Clostridia bacterium]
MNKTKEKIKITIIIFLLIFFLYTLRRIQVDRILNIDILIYDLIIRNEFLTSIMKFITLFAEWFTIVLLCIIFLVFLKDKRDAVAIIINSIVVTVITHGLKFIVQRPRPEDMNLIDMSGYSFPSGHTTTAV